MSNLNGLIVGKIVGPLYRYYLKKSQKKVFSDNAKYLKYGADSKLTPEEWKASTDFWGQLGFSYSQIYPAYYKKFLGFNPLFIPNDVYWPYILDSLNPPNLQEAFLDKGHYSFIYENMPQPRTFLRRIKGIYFDERGNVAKPDEFKFDETDGEVVLKPTNGSGGKGIKIFNMKNLDLKAIEAEYRQDFIIQERLKQSSTTSQLHEGSLNCFRVNTLFLNGRVTVLNVCLKFGLGDAIVDNLASGSGAWVGVNDDGTLHEFGYNSKMEKVYECAGGKKLKDITIPQITRILEFAKMNHVRYLPEMGIIGWDIALNQKDEPVMIEVNLKFPSSFMVQICCAKPQFRDRSQEVIDYVKRHQPRFFLPWNPWFF